MTPMRIGVGVATYERPQSLLRCLQSIERHGNGIVTRVVVHDDGSTEANRRQIDMLRHRFPEYRFHLSPHNRGVAVAKNRLLLTLLADDCDWCFLVEDDVEILAPQAFTGYIAACELSGIAHLNYHCPELGANHTPRSTRGPITLWPELGGVFSVFSREALLTCGLFDEAFYNAWEHIEHTQRLALGGYATRHRDDGNADATGSSHWLRLHLIESAGASKWDGTELRQDWQADIARQCQEWKTRRPDTHRLVFG